MDSILHRIPDTNAAAEVPESIEVVRAAVVGQFKFPQLCSSTKNPIPVFLSDSEGALRPEGESKDRENISFVHTASGSSTMHSASLRCFAEAIEQSQADHR